jgi:homoserine kinase
VIVARVPASSANIGPGFDALGMALSLYAEVGVLDGPPVPGAGRAAVDRHHPASVAFAAAGGRGSLWVQSPIPVGRGLGFSGAMRVAGAAAAVAQRAGGRPMSRHDDRAEIFEVAARLEGHGDNAAASVYGGIVVTDGARVVPVPTPLRPDVVVWVPAHATSTSASRADLPDTVPFADAVFNVGRAALLVATLAAGDVGALVDATRDRLHQPRRLGAAPGSAAALDRGLAAGAWCGWLSGSGPSVAFLVGAGAGAGLARSLPDDGAAKLLRIDADGVTFVAGERPNS